MKLEGQFAVKSKIIKNSYNMKNTYLQMVESCGRIHLKTQYVGDTVYV